MQVDREDADGKVSMKKMCALSKEFNTKISDDG